MVSAPRPTHQVGLSASDVLHIHGIQGQRGRHPVCPGKGTNDHHRPTPTDLKRFVRLSTKDRRRVDALQAVLGGDDSLKCGPVGVGVGVVGGGGGSGLVVTTSSRRTHRPANTAGAAAVSSNNGSRRHDFRGFHILPVRISSLDGLRLITVLDWMGILVWQQHTRVVCAQS